MPGYSTILLKCAISRQSACDMGYRKKNIRTYFIPIQRPILHPQPTNICNNYILMSALKELAAYTNEAVSNASGASFRVFSFSPAASLLCCLHPSNYKWCNNQQDMPILASSFNASTNEYDISAVIACDLYKYATHEPRCNFHSVKPVGGRVYIWQKCKCNMYRINGDTFLWLAQMSCTNKWTMP